MNAAATSTRAEDLVTKVSTLPSPPKIYERLMEVIRDPRSSAADIGRMISRDEALTVRLLKLVNSALLSLPRPVETVTTAVRVVGTRQVRDLAIATSVLTYFDDVPGDLIDLPTFWQHSLGAGVAARVIAQERGEENVERFFVAGLVHDVGRLIMLMHAPSEMAAALAEAATTGRDVSQCERYHVGCTHSYIGGLLLRQWNFPAFLEEAARHHHQPKASVRFTTEISVVHLADIIANALRWGYSGRPRPPRLERSAWDAVGIPASRVPTLLEQADNQLGAILDLVLAA